MKETKFKNTEIGRIPEEWETLYIHQITEISTGATPSTNINEYWENGTIRWMSSGELNNKIIYDVNGRITQKGYDNTGTHMLPKNCVLIGLAGQGKTRGTAAYNKVELCTNQSIAAILPNSKYESKYLYFYIDSLYDKLRLLSAGDGGRGGLNKQILRNLEIAMPPLNEQHRIASALTSIDNLIFSLGKLIEKKKNIKQGAMQQLLTGKTRLKGFNEPWMEKKLGDIGSLAMCKRIFQEETSEKGDVPFYKIGTFGQQADAYITKGKYEQFKQMYRFPQKGDVLISAAGTIGRTVIYNGEPAYFQDSNIVWLAHNGKYITNNFLFYIYQRTDWNTEDTTIARLYNNNFNNTCIHFPSSITEQQAIANILSKMDNEITALETKKAKYEAIKQGMMQQLLTGKIRLIS